MGYRCSRELCDKLRKELDERNISYIHLKNERRHKFWNTCIDEFKDVVQKVNNFTKFFEYYELKRCSKSTSRLRKIFDENKIDYSHFIDTNKKVINKGDKFGKWEIVKEVNKRDNLYRMWLCRCSCGMEKEVYQTHLVSGNSTGCIKCHVRNPTVRNLKWNNERVCGADNGNFKGYYEISKTRYSTIKKGAKTRNLEFDVSIEYLWDLYLNQERKCKLSGIEIKFGNYAYEYGTASLDRIDNNKGYVEGNVQWLHKDINKMKNTHDQDYFIDLCKKVNSEATRFKKSIS